MAEDSNEWEISDADLAAATNMERDVFGGGMGAEASIETAQRLFKENAVDAAMAIIHTAKNGATDRVRFDAAKYITERALGPAKDVPGSEKDDELIKFAKTIAGFSE